MVTEDYSAGYCIQYYCKGEMYFESQHIRWGMIQDLNLGHKDISQYFVLYIYS